MKNKSQLAKISIGAGTVALICLFLLHILSPEFDPDWRMVSEYALGKHKFFVSVFFIGWGISSILLAITLWPVVTNKKGKAGVVLLFISGIGATLASIFDVSHSTGHGFAALLGIPTVPVATLLISYHLSKKPEWQAHDKPIKVLAHLTWISLVLLVVTMFHMIGVFESAGIKMGPDASTPDSLPAGAVVFVGYVNRLMIIVDILWVAVVAKSYINLVVRSAVSFK
jgi:hypothetical protein